MTRTEPTRQSLQSRILSRALLISVVPLLLIGSVTLGSLLGLSNSATTNLEDSRQQLGRDVAGRSARASAVGVAREMEQLVAERIDDLIGLAAVPDVRGAARRSAEQTGDTLALQPIDELEQQFDQPRRLRAGTAVERFVRETAGRQAMLSELFFTERNGLNVVSSRRTSDFVQRDETWWDRAWSDGLFLGDVEQHESSDSYGLTVAVRIDSNGGEPLGVMKAVVDIAQLQQIATRKAADTGTDVSLLTGGGQLLAETRTDHSSDRIGNADLELDDDRAATAEIALNGSEPGFALEDTVVAGFAPLSVAQGRLATLLEPFDAVDTKPVDWVVLVEQTNEAAFAPLRGLAGVQRGLSSTSRTFAIIIGITLLGALLAAALVSARLAKRIVGPLRSLGAVARDIAERQLPMLVRHAQRTDGDEEPPSVPAVQLRTNDEIEDVADAFNIVTNTAAGLASEQAKSRRNVARMFVSLGRRNQNLLSRQLEFIDRLERDTADPDLLEDLFRLDHLATRMRRNAESLLVLAGEDSPRRWTEPVPLTNVVRGAVVEVEECQRVDVDGVDEAPLVGTAVSDVTHLLAELIENAARFSPPDSEVVVVGRRVVDGYALAVVDDGVGMSEEQLNDANHRLETSPLVDHVPASYLGLFVVGRLAARHGIRVCLVESTTEGVTAKVLLPTALVEPLSRVGQPREITAARRPRALAAGGPTSASAREGFAGSAHAGGGASTAVIDTPADDTAPADDDTQWLGPGARQHERAIGRRAARRGLQIDLREPADLAPGDDTPPSDAPDVFDVPDSTVTAAPDAVDQAVGEDHAETVQRPLIEVRRRTSKRSGINGVSDASAQDVHAVLRTESPVENTTAAEDPAPVIDPVSASAESPASSRATGDAVDEDGIALTASERQARAARDRLARFQRAVAQGRAQAKSQHDGGEPRDA